MRELTVVAPGKLRWLEKASPSIEGPLQALVRPIAACNCDLDRRLIAGAAPFKPPFAIGHECVAEVLEIGSAVETVRRGDVVSVPWKIACGVCDACLAGRSIACSSVRKYAAYGVPAGGHWGGLFSECVNVPFADAMLVKVPKGVDPVAAAAVSDNLTDAWVAASRPLAFRPNGKVLVVGGTESIGILAVQMARAAGAVEVDYFDEDAARNELASRSGANLRSGPDADLHERYDVVIAATRTHDKFRTSLLALRSGGHCSCIGIMFDDPSIPLFQMYMRDVTLSVGLCGVRPHMPRVLELIKEGRCDPMIVTPTTFAWEDAPDALVSATAKTVLVRPRITTSPN
jgi:alcohol dehydrogenase